MLSSGMQCYHLGCNVIFWSECYHLGQNAIIWDAMLSSRSNVASGTKCYHLGWNVIIWSQCYHLGLHVIIRDEMLSSGMQCYHQELMLSSGANVSMVSSGANVIIWCYHVMLSSGMITPPFFVFLGNFTHSQKCGKAGEKATRMRKVIRAKGKGKNCF
jgi:hypothetical protein